MNYNIIFNIFEYLPNEINIKYLDNVFNINDFCESFDIYGISKNELIKFSIENKRSDLCKHCVENYIEYKEILLEVLKDIDIYNIRNCPMIKSKISEINWLKNNYELDKIFGLDLLKVMNNMINENNIINIDRVYNDISECFNLKFVDIDDIDRPNIHSIGGNNVNDIGRISTYTMTLGYAEIY